jgi:hypothetical protein
LAEWIGIYGLSSEFSRLLIESADNQLLRVEFDDRWQTLRQTGAFPTDACALAAAIMVSIGMLVFSAAR